MRRVANWSQRLASGRKLTVLSLLPFLIACICATGNSKGQPIVDAEPRPALAFDQYLVHLGDVEPARIVRSRFVFTNRGSGPVEITGLEPSCGCLKPRVDQTVLEPNESGSFSLQVETANEGPGPHEYYCWVNYRDTKPRRAKVRFRVVLPQQIVIRPKALVFYQLSESETEHDIAITDYRGSKLRITNIETSSPWLKVQEGEKRDNEGGHTTSMLHATAAGGVPSGRHDALITVHTDDPVYSKLVIPVRIHGASAQISSEMAKQLK